MFIDSHTHLYLEQFDTDREEVVKRALENNVKKLLLPNIDSSTVQDMLKMSEQHQGVVYPMIGLHPGSVDENFKEELDVIREWSDKQHFIAIGEVGIDLYWEKKFKKHQVEAFEIQIDLAKKMNLPLVIHSRDSFKEIFEVLDRKFDKNLKGVFHSFTGGREEVEKINEYGFYFGINGIVTFKNSDLSGVVAGIPLEKILLETDSPYLAPVPKRGKRNESSFIPHIAKKISDIFEKNISEIAEITSDNTRKLFNLE
ncbi:MAG: TatD family hydrolase [Bacteroidales bacterium]